MGRPGDPAARGRGAAPRPGTLHGRPRAGAERPPRGDPPFAAPARANRAARRQRGARASRAWSACSPAPTSRRCRARSRPASTAAMPCYAAAAHERDALRRRAARGRRRARPLRRRGRARARSRSTTSRSSRCSTPSRGATEACVHDRSFAYGDVDAALAGADLVVRERFRFPRWSCTPVECYGVVCDWDEASGTLTAWANFQGPFTLHSVAAAALGLPGSKLRLITPRDSGGSLRDQVVGVRLRRPDGPRVPQLGVPVRWTEDRLEHLAASAASTGRVTELEAGVRRRRRTARAPLRRDRGRRRVRPRARSRRRSTGCTARSGGAYRVRDVATRNRVVLTNRCPTGLNRGFGGPQLYFALERTMAIAARRLGLDPADVAPPQPDRRGRVPLPHAVGRALRLRRLRRVPGRARSSSHVTRSGATSRRPRARRTARRHRARLRRRAVDLEHGLHHAGADAGGARGDAAEVRERGGGDGRRQPARRDHRADGDDAAGPGSPDGRGAGRRRRARRRPGRRRRPVRAGHVHGRVDRRLRQLLVPLLGRRCRCRPPGRAEGRQSCGDRRAGLGCRGRGRAARRQAWHGESVSLRRLAGHCALAPGCAAARDRAGPARDRVLRGAEPGRRRTTTTASRHRPRTASWSTSPSSRSSARPAPCASSTT